MAKIITTNKNEIIVNRFLVGKALDAFRTLVTEHKGEIGLTETKLYKATFKTNKTAKLVATALNAQYDEHNVRMPEPKKAKGSAPTKPTEKPHWQKGLDEIATLFERDRKIANREASAFLRANGLQPAGEAWDYWKSVR
jgi:hypothetical protein